MASLYTHRDSNIRKTWAMFSIFLVVVIGVGWVFSYVYEDVNILYIAAAFAVFMNVLAYWFSDKIVLSMHRAKEVTPENNKELYRIVENLAITAGLPIPKLYLVEEAQLNAFATGRNPKHAVIAVTRGLLEKLDRSELEGVLAHELSHIGNRDMLVSTVAVVLVGFVAILADIFLRSLWFGGGRREKGNQLLIIIGIAFAILAPIFLRLMRLAISRRRESLADASGALLTRYPEGLAKALEKIALDQTPMKRVNNSTSHLWIDDPYNHIGNKKTPWLHRIFMTHPPIHERIQALREK